MWINHATRSTLRKPCGKKFLKAMKFWCWANAKSIAVPILQPLTLRVAIKQQKVGSLSGGQRNRVHLAKNAQKGSNVLLLDEPTNDLDTETLAALEEALESYAGCAVVISHDRMFLDRLATHILAFEGDSQVEWFEGNYQDYEADKIRRLGADSILPKRIKYKQFLTLNQKTFLRTD